MSRLRADAVRADPPGAGAAPEVCWDGLESLAPSHTEYRGKCMLTKVKALLIGRDLGLDHRFQVTF